MLWEEFIEEERENVKTSTTIGYILEALSLSGQEIPAELRQKIEAEKDLEVLRIYFRKALTTKTIEEFENAIQILN